MMQEHMPIVTVQVTELDPRGSRISPNHIAVYPVNAEAGRRHKASLYDWLDDLVAVDGGSVDVAHVDRVLRDVCPIKSPAKFLI